MSPADDRKLIKVVECHHVLWDNRMKEFRDKTLTQHGWKSVAELLDREEDDVMYRWANLRKQYSRRITRLRQRTGNESPEKPWQLMPLMAFLRPCVTPRKRKHSSTLNNSFSSTEDISSGSGSDDSLQSSPLVVRINPVEPPRNSLFSAIPEKNAVPQNIGVQRKPFRKIIPKLKTASVCNLPLEKVPNSPPKEEQSYDPSPSTSPKAQKTEPNVHTLPATLKSQCGGVLKPPQTAIRSLPLKAKKLKTSSEGDLPSSINKTSESERKSKPLARKMSTFTKSTKLSSETEKRPKKISGKPLASAVKSTNASLETFPENSLPVVKNTNVSLEPEKRLKTFADASLPVAKSTSVPSEVLGHRGYDSDEHFLLSLADDFRKMDPRQKFECKIKMMGMVCEQYIKNEF